MKFIYIPLLVTFVTSIETTAEPCKTAGLLPVVNICTPDTKRQDNSGSVLVKANTTHNCTCELSVINQNKDISVVIQKFDQIASSSPLAYGCGLILTFGVGTNTNIWEAQCVVNNSGVTTSVKVNDKMTIKSFTVDGTLKENEGYCIQVKKGVDDTALYVSIAATAVRVATVIIVTIVVLYYRRFRILTQCKKSTCSGSNTIYDTLSLPSPANSTDNASISNNYSSLNINDFQSSNDNGRLEGSQNIPLSTISSVPGNHQEFTENEIQYENTNQRRTEYANLCL